MGSSGAVEREVKLAADPGLTLPDLDGARPGVSAGALPSQRLMATYYDTADLRLARMGVTVRYRSEVTAGAADIRGWTVKLPGQSGVPRGGLARQEVGFAGAERPVPPAVAHLVRGLTRSAPLVAVARLRTDRLRLALHSADDGPIAELDDDDVSVFLPGKGRQAVSRFREVEVELAPNADPAVLDAVVARLRAAGAGKPDPTPKLVRALGSRALEPPDTEIPWVASSKRTTVAEVIRTAIAAGVERLVRHDPGVRLGDDPEDVHQARVATRRLRSDLRTFRPLLDEERVTALRDDLGWIAELLGAVRDTDVLLGRLRSDVEELPEPDRPAGAALLRRLEDTREGARAALLGAMDSRRYTGLLDRLIDAVPPARSEKGRAVDVLPGLVRRPWRHLREAVAQLGPEPSDDALHRVRILAKRCRYAAEAAAPVIGKRAVRLADAVAELQGVLGDLHDAVVAEDWLRETTKGAPAAQALAAGELIAAQRRRAAACRDNWPSAWKAASAKQLRAWLRSK